MAVRLARPQGGHVTLRKYFGQKRETSVWSLDGLMQVGRHVLQPTYVCS